jgi:hypothetical protein
LAAAPALQAAMLFTATLTSAQQVPVNASPATGFGTVVLNDAQNQITVDLSWSGLTGPVIASHIHGPAGFGVNAPVLFPFAGVPAATSGSIPEQTFAITAAQVAQLEAGLFYFNIHTPNFPGGEIRGQIALAPEPSAVGLIGLGLAGIAFLRRRRRAA